MIAEIIHTIEISAVASFIFICAYGANVSFSLWYNIKVLRKPFNWIKFKDSIIKISVFSIGLILMCISITLLPELAGNIGWIVPDSYLEVFKNITIAVAFLTVTCKYLKEAYEKLLVILNG